MEIRICNPIMDFLVQPGIQGWVPQNYSVRFVVAMADRVSDVELTAICQLGHSTTDMELTAFRTLKCKKPMAKT